MPTGTPQRVGEDSTVVVAEEHIELLVYRRHHPGSVRATSDRYKGKQCGATCSPHLVTVVPLVPTAAYRSTRAARRAADQGRILHRGGERTVRGRRVPPHDHDGEASVGEDLNGCVALAVS